MFCDVLAVNAMYIAICGMTGLLIIRLSLALDLAYLTLAHAESATPSSPFDFQPPTIHRHKERMNR